MVTIYCIEDINDLKYIGSTNKTLPCRLTQHKYVKYKMKGKCSSRELNLYNCIIYSLETCNESNRKERERYWINKIKCVNHYKLNHDNQKYNIEWKKNNKEHIKKQQQEIALFRKKSVVNGCYEFIKMLDEY